MPEGVFYFEETIVQKTVKRAYQKQNKKKLLQKHTHTLFLLLALRTETQISMNFVPWKEIEEMCEQTESSVSRVCCNIIILYYIYGNHDTFWAPQEMDLI